MNDWANDMKLMHEKFGVHDWVFHLGVVVALMEQRCQMLKQAMKQLTLCKQP